MSSVTTIKAIAVSFLAAGMAHAAVARVEITERVDVPVANYERLEGKVYFTLDPKLAANRSIVDIQFAPKNAQGLVEFSADLRILRPKDIAKRNGTLVVEVPNRGRTSLPEIGTASGLNALRTAKDIGDPWMFDQGFTLAWVGWEFDLPEAAGTLKLKAPVLPGITGVVRAQIQTEKKVNTASLADRGMISYPVSDMAGGQMTVRDGIYGKRTEILRNQWTFKADGRGVEFESGFEPGRIYEVVYTAKDAVLVGAGLAAVRDYAVYAKEQKEATHTIAYGVSQNGRFLRTFLNDGFNVDEHGNKVFDGIWAHIAGGSRGGFNFRFAQPSRSRWLFPTDIPPFTPEELLVKSRASNTVPKLILSNSSQEYWNSGASLNTTSRDGKHDVAPPAGVRIFHIAGTQHVMMRPTSPEMPGQTQNLLNRLQNRWFMQTMMIAMNDWITKGTEPPPSRYPTVERGELVDIAHWKFPHLPHVNLPTYVYRPPALDFGGEFLSKGIISKEPPAASGELFQALAPQVDADGNEVAGIRMPELSVPLATYTGWNLRDPKIGAPEMRYGDTGSMFWFARTKDASDPRPSLDIRYKDREDYLSRVEAAARTMVADRYLLPRHVPEIVEHARQLWQRATGNK